MENIHGLQRKVFSLPFMFLTKENMFLAKNITRTGKSINSSITQKKWEGQEHSWHVTIYDKNGKVRSEYYMKKDANGKWPRMRG
jgi:hypothetical protein